MPATRPPLRNRAASRARARRVFTRLMEGQSTSDVASAEGLTIRRVQQIVSAELQRREANPAEDYLLTQVARLERAVERLGRQIDDGKLAAAAPFVRVIQMLSKLAPGPLRLSRPAFREPGAVAALTERLARLDAAREVVGERALAAQANRNDGQTIEKTDSGENADGAEASQA